MNRPSLYTYAFGNVVTVLGTYIVLAFVGYYWFIGRAEWGWALATLIVAAYCSQCANQIQAYRLWKLEWDAMGSKPKPQAMLDRWPWLRVVAGTIIWVVVIWAAYTKVEGDQRSLILWWFWAVSAVIVGYVIFKIWQAIGQRSKAATKMAAVSVSLPVPSQSDDFRQTYVMLPAYCTTLLRG